MSFEPSGQYEEINPNKDKIPEFDPRTGEHLWTMYVTYKVDPEKVIDSQEQGILDHENLLAVLGPACYHCEQSYSKLLASRRCRGHG